MSQPRKITEKLILAHSTEPSRITLKEFKDILENETGYNHSLIEYWSKLGSKKFNEFRNTLFTPITESDIESKRDKTTAKTVKKTKEEAIFRQVVGEDLCNYIDKGFSNYKWTPPNIKKVNVKTTREVTLFISDTHFGSDLNGAECPLPYGKTEEARRFSKVILETVNYKPQYRKETKLNLLLGGDIIQGCLHDPRQGAPVREQVARAMWLIEKAVKIFSKEFPLVDVYCTTGNHGRDKSRHKDRGVDQKWDSNEMDIYYGVYRATIGLSNVRFHIPLTPYVDVPIHNSHLFLTHGDTVLNVGFPSSNINIKSLENQTNKINAAKPLGVSYDMFAVGHVHTASVVRLPHKVIITNGALIPPDPYSQSIGSMDMANGQTLWESVPDHPFGDYRFIEVSEETDRDTTLDSIIPAWPGFPA